MLYDCGKLWKTLIDLTSRRYLTVAYRLLSSSPALKYAKFRDSFYIWSCIILKKRSYLNVLFRLVHKIAKNDYWLCHVRQSARPHGTTWHPVSEFSWNLEFAYFFRKSIDKVQVPLKSDRREDTLHEDGCTFMIKFPFIILRIINISEKSCR